MNTGDVGSSFEVAFEAVCAVAVVVGDVEAVAGLSIGCRSRPCRGQAVLLLLSSLLLAAGRMCSSNHWNRPQQAGKMSLSHR